MVRNYTSLLHVELSSGEYLPVVYLGETNNPNVVVATLRPHGAARVGDSLVFPRSSLVRKADDGQWYHLGRSRDYGFRRESTGGPNRPFRYLFTRGETLQVEVLGPGFEHGFLQREGYPLYRPTLTVMSLEEKYGYDKGEVFQASRQFLVTFDPGESKWATCAIIPEPILEAYRQKI